jgi:hypothetical protein
MGQIEEEAGAGIESDPVGVRTDPRVPGDAGVSEDDDPDREQTEHLLLDELAPLNIEDRAPGTVEIVGVPTTQTEIGAEGQLTVSVEAA